MEHEMKIEEFAAQIRERRGKRGLRDIANEIGEVSASTLSRIENGSVPDLDTFIRICRWLGVSPNTFTIDEGDSNVVDVNREPESKKALIKAHLRADRTLDPKTAEALARMIELAYEQAERGEISEDM